MLRNLIFDWSSTLADDLGPVVAATNRTLEGQPGVALLPHALEFLHFCRATRRRVFLLSTIDQTHFAEQSARLGVADFFEHAYVGIMDKRAQLARILAAHDLVPGETAFIGDMVHDVDAARAGGVMAIAILTGFDSREKLSRAQPEVMVRDLGELQKLLERATPSDEIVIEELELFVRVGVPEAERATPQRLTVSLRLEPRTNFHNLGDDLGRTVDYAAVCREIEGFVRDRTDRLIETLADAIAAHLIGHFALAKVELELRKYILPQTKYVAVRVARVAA